MTTIYGVACLHKCLLTRKPHLSTETGDFDLDCGAAGAYSNCSPFNN